MGPLRSLPLKSNKDKKREFFKKRLRASFLKKRPRQLTRKKFLKSIRPSSLNLKLPESPRKLMSKSASLSRRLTEKYEQTVIQNQVTTTEKQVTNLVQQIEQTEQTIIREIQEYKEESEEAGEEVDTTSKEAEE